MTPCTCTQPPGGGGSCGVNQIAICRAEAGQCHTTCVDLTNELSAKHDRGRLGISDMTHLVSSIFGQEYSAINKSTLISADGNSTVRYTLPKGRGHQRRTTVQAMR